jgi:(p)ppGpp synthase/HD superfamily hydrolase
MPHLTHRFEEALIYATRLHSSQLRKGTNIPYISHLLGVASLALEHGATEDEAIAALLHDAVEDQGGEPTLREIRRKFGDKVAEIVWGCTDSETYPKPPWRERKEQYIAHLHHATPSVRLVSACDKLHNARAILTDYRAIGDNLWTRFRTGKAGVLWYYRSLADTFNELGPASVAAELQLAVEELEEVVSQQ